MILGSFAPLVDTTQAEALARSITPLQMAILGVLVLVVVLALLRKLIKTAIVFAILAGIVGLAIYGHSQGWFG